jgi:hypothetical protein
LRSRRRGRRRREAFHFEQGEIRSRIATRELRAARLAIGKRDLDLFVTLDRVIRGHDYSRSPDHAARREMAPGVYGNDVGAETLHNFHEMTRKIGECVFHDSSCHH